MSEPTAALPAGSLHHELRWRAALTLLAVLLLLPAIALAMQAEFYVGVATRMLIYALVASSLNFILGFGGMVSFGHAAFVGIGAYTVGVLMQGGLYTAWLAWPAAFVAAGLFALFVGLVSLRTRGVYFIMITLAFAQMAYYLMISLQQFGGEDGLTLPARSTLWPGLDLGDDVVFYYVVLALALLFFLLLVRLLNSRFGHVLQAIRENETRVAALGFAVLHYKLLAFCIAGAVAGLAGALLANQAGFVSPASMHWTQSGVILVMVVLGGVGRIYGGLFGAVAFLLIEEVVSGYSIHWQFYLGAVLLFVVLRAPNGLLSMLEPAPRGRSGS